MWRRVRAGGASVPVAGVDDNNNTRRDEDSLESLDSLNTSKSMESLDSLTPYKSPMKKITSSASKKGLGIKSLFGGGGGGGSSATTSFSPLAMNRNNNRPPAIPKSGPTTTPAAAAASPLTPPSNVGGRQLRTQRRPFSPPTPTPTTIHEAIESHDSTTFDEFLSIIQSDNDVNESISPTVVSKKDVVPDENWHATTNTVEDGAPDSIGEEELGEDITLGRDESDRRWAINNSSVEDGTPDSVVEGGEEGSGEDDAPERRNGVEDCRCLWLCPGPVLRILRGPNARNLSAITD